MISIEEAKSSAQMLVKRYPNLTNAEEIVRKAIKDKVINPKHALAIWGRVFNITKN